MMVDFHSHILPCLDDGSHSLNESILLLNMLSKQSVDKVVATPHFYANDESVDSFLLRRQKAFDRLSLQLSDNHPEILLGAEVKYYSGIGRMQSLKKLCIGDSDLLLLEMPVSKWTEYTVREIIEMSNSGRMTIVLAHIERYFDFQNIGVWERLRDDGVLMQINAQFFINFFTKKRAFSLLKNGFFHFLGSDCHNTVSRPPRIGDALEVIEKKFGTNFLNEMTGFAYSMLS